MTDFNTIIYNKQGRVATITLNRPDAANGLDTEMSGELMQAASQAANDAEVKAVILTGSGRFFSAGGDVRAMSEFGDGIEVGLKQIADQLHSAISVFARMEAPLIVAVNGTAAGAGFSTAVAGDIVLAAESAKFTMAYTNVGLSPDGSSSYYLPRLIGMRKTQELMFTNRVLSAAEAVEWGLINSAVPDDELINEAEKLAQKFATGSKGSNGAVKKLLLTTWGNDLETQLDLETETICARGVSADGGEGISAFLEKRKPEFE